MWRSTINDINLNQLWLLPIFIMNFGKNFASGKMENDWNENRGSYLNMANCMQWVNMKSVHWIAVKMEFVTIHVSDELCSWYCIIHVLYDRQLWRLRSISSDDMNSSLNLGFVFFDVIIYISFVIDANPYFKVNTYFAVSTVYWSQIAFTWSFPSGKQNKSWHISWKFKWTRC